METVDSNQKQLRPDEIIAMAAHQQQLGNLNPTQAMLAVATESAEKSLDMKQTGNTLWMTHIGKGKNKDMGNFRPINVDTAQNLIKHMRVYLEHIHGKGVRKLASKFNFTPYVNGIRIMARQVRAEVPENKLSMTLSRTQSGAYVIKIVMAEDLF